MPMLAGTESVYLIVPSIHFRFRFLAVQEPSPDTQLHENFRDP